MGLPGTRTSRLAAAVTEQTEQQTQPQTQPGVDGMWSIPRTTHATPTSRPWARR